MTSNPSYWMLADTEVPLAWDANRIDAFAAYFKHALLFNERLMLSDAQAVNCMNFRRLLKSDSDFQKVLDASVLSIAVRAPEDAPFGHRLTEVRDAFATEGKQRSDIETEFFSNEDLDRINESCDIRLYRYEQLREHYTQKVFSIFERASVAGALGGSVQALLIDVLKEESDRNNGLGRVFLYDGLGKVLEARGASEIWQQHRDTIVQLSDAPYVTGIPSVMAANPIYSPVHQKSFELAYDAGPTETESVEGLKPLPIYSDLDLSSYEQGLQKLSIDDVMSLRSSAEFKRFQKHSSGSVIRESQLDDVMMALADYQRAIDRYIIDRHLGRRTRVSGNAARFVTPLLKVAREGGLFSFGLLLTDVLAGGALSLANFFAGEALDYRGRVAQQSMDLEKRKLLGEFSAGEGGGKISARVTSRENTETLYSSAC
ncbi:hypothetical protein [Methylophaga sp.]|uniref:hypothetical protein n=1 Tax=Methylophaga sp. TaxID=2024840 RepID=UPI003A94A799